MVKRLTIALGFALFLALATQIARADDPPGAKLYATYCAACHGASGKGGFAPAIGDAQYLGAHDDAAITRVTREGVAGKGMPAWSKSKGGALTDDQIDNIVAYLRAFASSASVPTTSSTEQTSAATNDDYAQTRIAMTQSQNADGAMALVATLRKFDGSPVGGQVIAFTRATTFGVVDLGTAKTDKLGNATLVVREQSESARNITATFKGTSDLGSSAALIALDYPVVAMSSGDVNLNGMRLSIDDEPLLAPDGSLITPNPPLVPTLLFVSVVGCIWATFGFVVYQVYGIWKCGQNTRRENVFAVRKR